MAPSAQKALFALVLAVTLTASVDAQTSSMTATMSPTSSMTTTASMTKTSSKSGSDTPYSISQTPSGSMAASSSLTKSPVQSSVATATQTMTPTSTVTGTASAIIPSRSGTIAASPSPSKSEPPTASGTVTSSGAGSGTTTAFATSSASGTGSATKSDPPTQSSTTTQSPSVRPSTSGSASKSALPTQSTSGTPLPSQSASASAAVSRSAPSSGSPAASALGSPLASSAGSMMASSSPISTLPRVTMLLDNTAAGTLVTRMGGVNGSSVGAQPMWSLWDNLDPTVPALSQSIGYPFAVRPEYDGSVIDLAGLGFEVAGVTPLAETFTSFSMLFQLWDADDSGNPMPTATGASRAGVRYSFWMPLGAATSSPQFISINFPSASFSNPAPGRDGPYAADVWGSWVIVNTPEGRSRSGKYFISVAVSAAPVPAWTNSTLAASHFRISAGQTPGADGTWPVPTGPVLVVPTDRSRALVGSESAPGTAPRPWTVAPTSGNLKLTVFGCYSDLARSSSGGCQWDNSIAYGNSYRGDGSPTGLPSASPAPTHTRDGTPSSSATGLRAGSALASPATSVAGTATAVATSATSAAFTATAVTSPAASVPGTATAVTTYAYTPAPSSAFTTTAVTTPAASAAGTATAPGTPYVYPSQMPMPSQSPVVCPLVPLSFSGRGTSGETPLLPAGATNITAAYLNVFKPANCGYSLPWGTYIPSNTEGPRHIIAVDLGSSFNPGGRLIIDTCGPDTTVDTVVWVGHLWECGTPSYGPGPAYNTAARRMQTTGGGSTGMNPGYFSCSSYNDEACVGGSHVETSPYAPVTYVVVQVKGNASQLQPWDTFRVRWSYIVPAAVLADNTCGTNCRTSTVWSGNASTIDGDYHVLYDSRATAGTTTAPVSQPIGYPLTLTAGVAFVKLTNVIYELAIASPQSPSPLTIGGIVSLLDADEAGFPIAGRKPRAQVTLAVTGNLTAWEPGYFEYVMLNTTRNSSGTPWRGGLVRSTTTGNWALDRNAADSPASGKYFLSFSAYNPLPTTQRVALLLGQTSGYFAQPYPVNTGIQVPTNRSWAQVGAGADERPWAASPSTGNVRLMLQGCASAQGCGDVQPSPYPTPSATPSAGPCPYVPAVAALRGPSGSTPVILLSAPRQDSFFIRSYSSPEGSSTGGGYDTCQTMGPNGTIDNANVHGRWLVKIDLGDAIGAMVGNGYQSGSGTGSGASGGNGAGNDLQLSIDTCSDGNTAPTSISLGYLNQCADPSNANAYNSGMGGSAVYCSGSMGAQRCPNGRPGVRMIFRPWSRYLYVVVDAVLGPAQPPSPATGNGSAPCGWQYANGTQWFVPCPSPPPSSTPIAPPANLGFQLAYAVLSQPKASVLLDNTAAGTLVTRMGGVNGSSVGAQPMWSLWDNLDPTVPALSQSIGYPFAVRPEYDGSVIDLAGLGFEVAGVTPPEEAFTSFSMLFQLWDADESGNPMPTATGASRAGVRYSFWMPLGAAVSAPQFTMIPLSSESFSGGNNGGDGPYAADVWGSWVIVNTPEGRSRSGKYFISVAVSAAPVPAWALDGSSGSDNHNGSGTAYTNTYTPAPGSGGAYTYTPAPAASGQSAFQSTGTPMFLAYGTPSSDVLMTPRDRALSEAANGTGSSFASATPSGRFASTAAQLQPSTVTPSGRFAVDQSAAPSSVMTATPTQWVAGGASSGSTSTVSGTTSPRAQNGTPVMSSYATSTGAPTPGATGPTGAQPLMSRFRISVGQTFPDGTWPVPTGPVLVVPTDRSRALVGSESAPGTAPRPWTVAPTSGNLKLTVFGCYSDLARSSSGGCQWDGSIMYGNERRGDGSPTAVPSASPAPTPTRRGTPSGTASNTPTGSPGASRSQTSTATGSPAPRAIVASLEAITTTMSPAQWIARGGQGLSLFRGYRVAEGGSFVDVTFTFPFPPPAGARVTFTLVPPPGMTAASAANVWEHMRGSIVRRTSSGTWMNQTTLIFGAGETSITMSLGYSRDGVATGAAQYPPFNITGVVSDPSMPVFFPSVGFTVDEADKVGLSVNVPGAYYPLVATSDAPGWNQWYKLNLAEAPTTTSDRRSSGVVTISLLSAPAPTSTGATATGTDSEPFVTVRVAMPQGLCSGARGIRPNSPVPCTTAADCAATGVVGSVCLPAPTIVTNASRLVFTRSNWNVPQGVQVTVVNNAIDETGPWSKFYGQLLTFAAEAGGSAQPAWASVNASVVVDVQDDDFAGFTVAGSGRAAENSLHDYSITLTSQPRGEVAIAPSVSYESAAALFIAPPADPSAWRRGPSNWQVPITITVSVLNNFVDEGADPTWTIQHAVSTGSAGTTGAASPDLYASVSAPAYRLTVANDDRAQLLSQLIPAAANDQLSPGASGFRLACWTFASMPRAWTDMRLASNAATSVDTTSNPYMAQALTTVPMQALSAQPDGISAGPIFAPPGYNPTLTSLLRSAVTPQSVSPDAWRFPRCIGVAIPTAQPVGSWVQLSATPLTTDPIYAAMTQASMTTQLVAPQLSFSLPGQRVLSVVEGGGNVSFTVSTAPNASTAGLTRVTVVAASGFCSRAGMLQLAFPCSTSDECRYMAGDNDAAVCVDGLGLRVSPAVIDLSAAGASATVTVSAIDDSVFEGALHPSQIKFFAPPAALDAPPAYLGGLPVLISDNDGAGLVTTVVSPTAYENGSASAVYTLALRARPAASVRVVSSFSPALLTPNVSTLTFTQENWNVPQAIALAAVQDSIATGGPGGVFSVASKHMMASTDVSYSGVDQSAAPTFSVVDNDIPAVALVSCAAPAPAPGPAPTASGNTSAAVCRPVQLSDISIFEGAEPATLFVSLSTQPASGFATVRLTADLPVFRTAVTATSAVTGVSTLTSSVDVRFSADQPWNSMVPIQLSVADDDVDSGPRTTNIRLTASGSSEYLALRGAGMVPVIDNDAAGMQVQAFGLSSLREGASAQVLLRLTSRVGGANLVALSLDSSAPARLSIDPAVIYFRNESSFRWANVTVRAISDGVVNGDANVTIRASLSSLTTDPAYLRRAESLTQSGRVTVLDANTRGLTVEAPWDVSQPQVLLRGLPDAGSSNFTVRFASAVTASTPVTVTLQGTAADSFTVFADQSTVTPTSWTDGVRVFVTSRTDARFMTPAATDVTVRFSAAGWPDVSVPYRVYLGRPVGLAIAPGAGATGFVLRESGVLALAVRLTSQPAGAVTVGSADFDASIAVQSRVGFVNASSDVARMVWTEATWNETRVISLAFADDAYAAVNEAVRVCLTTRSAFAPYSAVSACQRVSLVDNDVPALNVSVIANAPGAASDSGAVVEGSSSLLLVNFATQLRGPVFLYASASPDTGRLVLPPMPLLVQPGSSFQVPVSILDDSTIGNSETTTLTFYSRPVTGTTTGGRPVEAGYTGLSATTALRIIDNDASGRIPVELSVALTPVNENGTYALRHATGAVLSLSLTARPTAPVTVTVAVVAVAAESVSGGALVLSQSSFTFTPASYKAPLPFSVFGSLADAPRTGAMTADGLYTARLVVTSQSSDAHFATSLTLPGPVVTFTVAQAAGSVPGNKTAADAPLIGVSTDPAVTGEAPYLVRIWEGNATAPVAWVKLTAQPTSPVVVGLGGSAADRVVFASPSLVFTPGSWNVSQPIALSAPRDFIATDGETRFALDLASQSEDARFAYSPATATGQAVLPRITLAVVDTDQAGAVLEPSSLSLSELHLYSTGEGSLGLTTAPTGLVVLQLQPADGVTVEPSTFTFTPQADGSVPPAQPFTVRVSDNAVDEGSATYPRSVVVHVAPETVDRAYVGVTLPSLRLVIANDDRASVVAVDAAGAPLTFIHIAEADGAAVELPTEATYLVSLGSQPLSPVMVRLSAQAGFCTVRGESGASNFTASCFDSRGCPFGQFCKDFGAVTVSPSMLSFTPSSYAFPQEVTVSAAHIPVDQPDVTAFILRHAVVQSGDAVYASAAPTDVRIAVHDVDVAGVMIDTDDAVDVAGDAALFVEEDQSSPLRSASFRVRLGAQPLGPVVLDITFDALQVSVDSDGTATLVFTPDDFDQAQTITVTAVDDLLDEAKPHLTWVNLTSRSADGAQGVPVGGVKVYVMDNDWAGIAIGYPNRIGTAIARSRSASYPDAMCARCVSTASLSCTASCAVYRGVSTDLAVVEGDPADVFTVRLTSRPTASVTVVVPGAVANITGAAVQLNCLPNPEGTGVQGMQDQLVASSVTALVNGSVVSVLTISPSAWRTVFSVAVAARDDRIVEGPHNVTITPRVFSADRNYGGPLGSLDIGGDSCASSDSVLPVTNVNAARQHPRLAAAIAAGRASLTQAGVPLASSSACPSRLPRSVRVGLYEPGAVAAPRLASAVFSADLASVAIRFTGDVDVPLTGSWACAQAFTVKAATGPTAGGADASCALPTTTELAASDALLQAESCTLKDSRTIVARLRPSSGLKPGDLLQVVPRVIRAPGSALSAVTGNVTVTGPPVPVVPTASLGSDRSIGSCEGVRLSAFVAGAGGRPFGISWKLLSATNAAGASMLSQSESTALAALLAAYNASSSIALEAPMLPAGWTLVLQANVTNFLGAWGTSSITVRKAGLPLPQLSSASSSTTVLVSQALRLSVRAIAPSCSALSAEARAMSFYWFDVTNGGYPELSVDSNAALFGIPLTASAAVQFALPGGGSEARPLVAPAGRTLNVPGFTLRADGAYVFAVYAVLDSDPRAFTSLTFTVKAQGDPLQARIAGGVARTASLADDVVIDGSGSSDPSLAATASNTLYRWTCAPNSEANSEAGLETDVTDCGGLDFSGYTGSSLTIPSRTLTAGAAYDIGLVYTVGSRNASAVQTLTITAAATVGVEITAPDAIEGKVPTTEPVMISVEVTSPISGEPYYAWTQTAGPQLDEAMLADPARVPFGTDSDTLLLSESQLQPDSDYAFCVDVDAGTDGVNRACVEFHTAPIPVLGGVAVYPASEANATAFSPFMVALEAVSGEVSRVEYRYRAAATTEGADVAYTLFDTRPPSDRLFTTTLLPAGVWIVEATAVSPYGTFAVSASANFTVGTYHGSANDALNLALATAGDGDPTSTIAMTNGALKVIGSSGNGTTGSGSARRLRRLSADSDSSQITSQMRTLFQLTNVSISQVLTAPSASLWSTLAANLATIAQTARTSGAVGAFPDGRAVVARLIGSIQRFLASETGVSAPTANELLAAAYRAWGALLNQTDSAEVGRFRESLRNITGSRLRSGDEPVVIASGDLVASMAKRTAGGLSSGSFPAAGSGAAALPAITFGSAASSAVSAALGSISSEATVHMQRCASGDCSGASSATLPRVVYAPVQVTVLDSSSREVPMRSTSELLTIALPASVAAAACGTGAAAPTTAGATVPTAVYFNTSSGTWLHDGVTLACSGSSSVSLVAKHLTAFAVANESAALVIVAYGAGSTPASTNVTATLPESATATALMVALNAQPDSDVTVTLSAPTGFCYDSSTSSTASASWAVRTACSATAPCSTGTCVSTGIGLGATSLAFTTANWATPQAVSVTVTPDAIFEGASQAYTVTLTSSSSDSRYSAPANTGATVRVTVTETDMAPAVVAVNTAGLLPAFSESMSAPLSWTVALSSKPLSNVVVRATLSGVGAALTSATSVTFTPANWNVPQGFTAAAVNDAIVNGNRTVTLIHTVTSFDPRYASLPAQANASLTVTDDDAAGITLPVALTASEVLEGGAGASFTAVLTSQPTGVVTLNVDVASTRVNWTYAVTVSDGSSSSTSSVATSGRVTVVFTDTTWATLRTITVAAVSDGSITGDAGITVRTSLTTAATEYAALPTAGINRAYALTVQDAQSPGIAVVPTAGGASLTVALIAGSGSATYGVSLLTAPTGTVVIDVTQIIPAGNAGYPTPLMVTPSRLTFAPASYNSPQTVTVTAGTVYALPVASAFRLNHTVNATASTDASYASSVVRFLPVQLTGVPAAGVTLTLGAPVLSEGASFTVAVSVASQPLSNVVVSLTQSAPGPVLVFSPSSVTIGPSDWMYPVNVTVMYGQDSTSYPSAALAKIVTATVTGGDANYFALAPVTAAVTLNNDDVAGLTLVAPAAGSVISGADWVNYTVRLATAPLASVTVGVAVNDTARVQVSTATLTFTTVDWSTPKAVGLRLRDATLPTGRNATVALILTPASASDSVYAAVPASTVNLPYSIGTTPGAGPGGDAGGDSGRLSAGGIAGIIIGVVGAVVLLAGGIRVALHSRMAAKAAVPTPADLSDQRLASAALSTTVEGVQYREPSPRNAAGTGAHVMPQGGRQDYHPSAVKGNGSRGNDATYI